MPIRLPGLIVETVSLRSFRSYERLELAVQPGLVLAVGPNGVGKTNLLEAIHVATQGFSPRTRTDAQLVRFGDDGARAAVAGRRGEVGLETRGDDPAAARGSAREAERRAAARGRAAALRRCPRSSSRRTGSASSRARRPRGARTSTACSDASLPARAPLPTEYGAAVAQRNAALRRAVTVGALEPRGGGAVDASASRRSVPSSSRPGRDARAARAVVRASGRASSACRR